MMPAMRVVHVESGRHQYGGGQQVRYLIADLARAGVDNVLVCAAGSPLARAVPEAEVIELRMGGDADVSLWPRLTRVLRRVKPDLVHVHSRRGADLFAGLAARDCGVPALLTRRVESAEPAPVLRFKCRPYRYVVAISRAIAHDLVARVGLAPARVRHLASAVDTSLFRPEAAVPSMRAALGISPDAPAVAVVSQLIERKGHRVLLEALRSVAAGLPGIRVVCFGQGPLAPALGAEARALGLDAQIRFLGYRSDLPRWLPQFDLLVHPALREGLGVALLEAQSAGVPIVASAVGGIVDLVEHGVTGCLVPAGNPAALAAAMTGLLADPARRAAMAAAGRAQVERRFAADRLAAQHLPLYAAAGHG
jgi:glycosyltransferase involved in cell wall biosynthesis